MDKQHLINEIDALRSSISSKHRRIAVLQYDYIEANKLCSIGTVLNTTQDEKYIVVGNPYFALNIEAEYDIIYPCALLKKDGQPNMKRKRDLAQRGIEKGHYTIS